MAAMTRAVFGPRWPMLYAPIPPAPRPPLQSAQLTAVPGGAVPMASEPVRQVPAFLNAHHAGSVALAEARSITISSPDVWSRPAAPSSNVPTRVLAPALEAQAKFRL